MGEGFIVERQGRLLATINLGNHLDLMILDAKEELNNR